MSSGSRNPDRQGDDEEIDTAIDESFPASDPPSFTPTIGAGAADPSPPEEDATAKGYPHSDRQETETAAGRQEGRQPPEHKDS